jgi:hypothetical protein
VIDFTPLLAELKQQHSETRGVHDAMRAAGMKIDDGLAARHMARVRIARIMHALSLAAARNPDAVSRLIGDDT